MKRAVALMVFRRVVGIENDSTVRVWWPLSHITDRLLDDVDRESGIFAPICLPEARNA